MSDIIASAPRTNRPNSPIDRFQGGVVAPDQGVQGKINLDSNESRKLHSNLLGHYLAELDKQAGNRAEMAKDERFYDNDPWTDEEKFILAQRGQMATNYNVISTTLNWLIGTERRGRTDYKILARRKEGSAAAERKTELLKYLSDANNSEFASSQAFASAVKCGIGWLEAGWQADDEGGEPIYDRAESWRNILWDSLANAPDFSDGRFMFRTKWTDIDNAVALTPDREEMITTAAASSLNFGASLDQFGDEAMDEWENTASSTARSAPGMSATSRDRVRLIEGWFRKPAMTRVIVGGDFSGEIFDEFSEGHLRDVDAGRASIHKRVKMRTFVSLFTTAGLLYLAPSPYRHNRYPFTPIICYRKASDGSPYGLIRGMRDLQTHINKSASKAQYVLATNKTIMEKGAVDDLEQYEEEAARPDAIIVVNPGKRLEMNVDRDLAPAHLDLMSRMIQMVQQQSGVTDESLGRTTNAVSGKAIVARQDQGALATAEPFDNLRFARKIHGEKMLSLTEQFMSEQKSFRITDQRGNPQYININDTPENDITRTKADFIISEQSWHATMRQAGVEALMEFVARVAPGQPQVVMAILDLVAEGMDELPNREEIVKRIRQITGMKDPDADPNAPKSPEEMAQEQAKAEADAMQKRGAMAEIAKMENEAKLKAAQAEKAGADAQKVMEGLPLDRMSALKSALEAALAVISVPQSVPVADRLLDHAGFATAHPNPEEMAEGETAPAAVHPPFNPASPSLPPQP